MKATDIAITMKFLRTLALVFLIGPQITFGQVHSKVPDSDGMELKIVKAERDDSDSGAASNPELYYRAFRKWLITTELTNKSKKLKLILRSPSYCGAVGGRLDQQPFVPGSRLPFQSKENDLFVLPPSGVIRTEHVVYAVPDKSGDSFVLSGFTFRMQYKSTELHYNDFLLEWLLLEHPIKDEFELSMVYIGRKPFQSKGMLGADYDKVWEGMVVSKPVKLTVFKSLEPAIK